MSFTRFARLSSASSRIASTRRVTMVPLFTRSLHPSGPTQNKDSSDTGHTADSYSKEVDSNPAPDQTIHRVDSSADTTQRPLDPPKHSYSEAGAKAGYNQTSKEEPYKQEGEEGGKHRYGSGQEGKPKGDQ